MLAPPAAPAGAPAASGGVVATPAPGSGTATAQDLTGSYLGAGGVATAQAPRIVPNPFDNTILIQGTPQEYESILKLLREIDIPPRQVLIDAKIYEVSLTHGFAHGVQAYFRQRSEALPFKQLQVENPGGGFGLSVGALVGQSRELLAFLTASENTTQAKLVSAPSIIATDSIPASINVGTEVPTLTAQAVTGLQQGGNSLFANSIANRNSGVTLSITARINPSGVVTLVINQEISAPVPPQAGEIQSPSFSKRTIQTQVTVEDGDTIAIGGIINEGNARSSAGIPILHRIPVIGGAFGNKSISSDRTELIVFMTPRVIYDTNQLIDASEELKDKLGRLRKIITE
jgi:general secretion pathway protein D